MGSPSDTCVYVLFQTVSDLCARWALVMVCLWAPLSGYARPLMFINSLKHNILKQSLKRFKQATPVFKYSLGHEGERGERNTRHQNSS